MIGLDDEATIKGQGSWQDTAAHSNASWRIGLLIALIWTGGCGSTSEAGGIHLDRLDGGIMLETNFRNERYDDGFRTTETKETILRESLLLDIKGDIYHRRLIEYRALLDIGFQQQFVDRQTSQQDERNDLNNNQYDVHAFILPDMAYTSDLFALRSQVQTRQSFFPTSDAVITRYGLNIRAKEWVIPSWLHYDHFVYEGRVGDDRMERRENLQLQGAESSRAVDAQYRIEYNNIDTNIIAAPYDDYQANAGLGYSFGEAYDNRMTLSGNFRTQTGAFSSEAASVITGLDLDMTDTLQWDSRFSYDQTRYASLQSASTDTFDWNSFLRHSLFESLETSLGLRGFRQSFGLGKVGRDGIFGVLDYHKKTTFGEIRFTLRPDYFMQDETGAADLSISVSNESHRVDATRVFALDNLAVEAATIFVTDATGLTVYVEPGDYVVSQAGLSTRISIPISSRVTVGQELLVSYQYRANSARKFTSFNNQTSLGFTFLDYSDVEFRWGRVEQRLLEGRPDATLEQSDEFAVLLTMHHRAISGHLEYLNRNSNLTPLSRLSLGGDVDYSAADNLHMNGSATYFQTYFKDTGQEEWGFNLTGTLNFIVTDELRFDVLALFRRADQISDEGRGWFLESKLIYDLRDTVFILRLTASQERWQFQNDQDVLRAHVMIKRLF